MLSIQDIADRIRDGARTPMGLADALAPLYADEVYVRHVPPMPADGFKAGSHIAALHRGETETWIKNIDNYHHDNVEVKVRGDAVDLMLVLAGTMPDRKKLAVPVRMTFKVKNGVIYDSELETDAEASKPMMEFVVNANLPVDLIWDPFAKPKV